jgi:hypothetical protein
MIWPNERSRVNAGAPLTASVTPMEIAGSPCAVCGRKVLIAYEGKCCRACSIVVHQTCDIGATCARCGRNYEVQERPILNLAQDAVVPRTLRRDGNGAPIAMVVLAAVLLLLFLFGMILLLLH